MPAPRPGEEKEATAMFIPSTTLVDTETNRYDYLQATEASVMEDLFTKYIAALDAANNVPSNPQLGILDVDIAGGGDGHTFVLRILVSEAVSMAGWSVAQLPNVNGRFWMGSDAEALEAYQEAAIASLLAITGVATNVAVGTAGAAKGTRFMAFIAAVSPPQ
jgi:hypothetical protein